MATSSASYARALVGGRLRLKGHGLVGGKKKKKKRRKKKRKKEDGEDDEEGRVSVREQGGGEGEEKEGDALEPHRKKARVHDDEDDEEDEYEVVDTRTEAQKRFEEVQKAREARVVEEKAQETYRQRIEKYNKHLAGLTEHNDLPRVTPGPR